MVARVFSENLGNRRLSGESVIGIAYLVAAACVILILNSPHVTQEAHEVNDLLYGNAVAVPPEQLYIMSAAAIVVALVHGLFGKEFVFTTFDLEMARTLGLRTGFWSLLLFLTLALAISVSTRAIGALPVFAFTVIPPAAALLVGVAHVGGVRHRHRHRGRLGVHRQLGGVAMAAADGSGDGARLGALFAAGDSAAGVRQKETWMRACLAVIVLVAATATAQAQVDGGTTPDDGGVAAPDDGGVSEAEIQKALQSDVAAQKKDQAAAAAPVPAPTPQTTGSGFGAALGRVFQTLNPDISAIVDFAAGWYQDDKGTIKSGDDPQATGFNAQEVELALQAVVDPYFRADIYLTIPNLRGDRGRGGVPDDDAPAGELSDQGRHVSRAESAGRTRSICTFRTSRGVPRSTRSFSASTGCARPASRSTGWCRGCPSTSCWRRRRSRSDPPTSMSRCRRSAAARAGISPTSATARAFFPLSEATSLYAGLNYAHGKTSQRVAGNDALPSTAEGLTLYDNYYDNLYGADLYLKWKPPNQVRSYASVAWQTEYFVRQIPNVLIGGVRHQQVEGGLYSQVVLQVHRRWYLGMRGEIDGHSLGRQRQARVRGRGQHHLGALGVLAHPPLRRGALRAALPAGGRAAASDALNGAAFLQLEAAIGAHGAHPF